MIVAGFAMTATRSPKKTEMLEIRLSHDAKTAFMARCQAEGVTASDVIRGFIGQTLTQSPSKKRRTRLGGWHALAAALSSDPNEPDEPDTVFWPARRRDAPFASR